MANDPILVTIPITNPEAVADAELALLAAIQPNSTCNGNGNGGYALNRLS